MEDVLDIIRKRGFYFIRTKVLYPDFVGPEYIIVTDDADIVKKHPKMVGMIIVPVSKFEKMAEEYNRYFGNEDREKHRESKYHIDEGYSEEITEDETGEHQLNPLDIESSPIEDAVENNELKEKLLEAMKNLTPLQKERIKKYYFLQMTYDEIAASENVGKMAVYRSIRAGINKMRKSFFENF